jgi:site-specific DNA-methyltransferase (adenine-specific)
MGDLIPLLYHAAKPQAHMYLFCDFDRFHELKKICEESGWYVFRTPLVYFKTGGGRVPLPEMGPRRCYELVLYAVKGKKPVTHIYPDVIQAAADAQESHGAQKSVAVFQNLLQRSCSPGDHILDPCAGTGTVVLAGHNLKCRVTAVEQAADYFGVMVKRVQSL